MKNKDEKRLLELFLSRPLGPILLGLQPRDLHRHVEAADDAAEDGVPRGAWREPVQKAVVRHVDEELRATCERYW